MENLRMNAVAAAPISTNPVYKPKDLPLAIIRICCAREQAYRAYPHSVHFKQKIEIIHMIKYECRALLNEHPAIVCKRVFALRNYLEMIAPSETSKLKKSYLTKVEQILLTAQEFLNRR